MRIARVAMVCIALISTLFGAETERSKRRSQPKDHLPQPRTESDSTTPVTFTTLRPIAAPINHQIDRNLHSAVSRRIPRVHTGRFALIKIRESTGPRIHRRRRQLLRRRKNRLGRSFDLHDAQKIETVHGHEERVVHLEPIYRVTKNENIFDSIIDLIRRIIGSEKSIGPLVGPFNFPGVGDKVYVRLLEPVPPDHLVIRMITHAPATEVVKEVVREVPAPVEIPKHPEIPSPIDHASLVVHSDDLINSISQHDVVSTVESDTIISSSNNLVKTLKPSSQLDQKVAGSGLRTYRTNERINSTTDAPSKDQFDWTFAARFNDSLKDQGMVGYQDSMNQVYHFYPPLNDTSQVDFGGLNMDVQEFPEPFNVSEFQQEVGPIIPYRDYSSENRQEFKKELAGSTEEPKYSINFVSKKMRYLNMDGSVDLPGENEDKGFKPMEKGSGSQKTFRSADNRKRVVRRIVRRRDGMNVKKDRRGGNERFPEVHQRSRNVYGNNTAMRLQENGNSTDLRGI